MDLLTSQGHEVRAFARKTPMDLPSELSGFFPEDMKTDRLNLGFGAFRTLKEIIYSSEAKRCLGRALETFTPDIAHAHNIYGRLTTSVLDLLSRNGIPAVMTLHDYKLVCPSYKLMAGGKVCEDCKGRNYSAAVRNRCHKNSRAASAVYSFESWFNDVFKKYDKNIAFFISPSRFLKSKLMEFGYPEDKIVYIPNYIESEKFLPRYEGEDYLVYIGRLSAEKGISTLLKAFKTLKAESTKLVIAGDGPMRAELEAMAGQDGRIRFLGYLSGQALSDVTRNARAVVIPSEWYENAPISVLEAFAFGKPVIGARIGGIPEMVDEYKNGLLFESGEDEALAEKLNEFLCYPEKTVAEMGRAGRKKAETEYSRALHYEKLVQVYAHAMRVNG
nr:glycosyltransferase family 4 protein [Desulfobacula sp.]